MLQTGKSQNPQLGLPSSGTVIGMNNFRKAIGKTGMDNIVLKMEDVKVSLL